MQSTDVMIDKHVSIKNLGGFANLHNLSSNMAAVERDIMTTVKLTVTIREENLEALKEFINSNGGQICGDHIVLNGIDDAPAANEETLPSRTPSELAYKIRTWLKVHRVSVALFASEILKRSQGTVSTLLNKPPQSQPIGAGGEPWQAMAKFLNSKALQDSLKESASSKSKSGEKQQDQSGEKPTKARKIYTRAELASLDVIFEGSGGMPPQSVVENLSQTLEVTQVQNWFQNKRRMQRQGEYTPGQYSK